jgi:hypothetical protein
MGLVVAAASCWGRPAATRARPGPPRPSSDARTTFARVRPKTTRRSPSHRRPPRRAVDRDYRTEEQCKELKARLQAAQVRCHIWKRKELESYLLDPGGIARVTGAGEDWVEEALAQAAEELENDVFALVGAETQKLFRRDQPSQALKAGKKRFEELWADRATRKWTAPPEGVLHGLNRRLGEAGLKTTSFRELARELQADEIPGEMVRFLDRVESRLAEAGVPALVR